MTWFAFCFATGLLASNATEWWVHRYVLHGLGKRRRSFWAFHFHEHHQASRRHQMMDAAYQRFPIGRHAQGKELFSLLAPFAFGGAISVVVPGFGVAVMLSVVLYYLVHKRSHQDPGWARIYLRWHYDHHMGPDPHSNWCVTFPWFDHVMGTRRRYAGTPREARDLARSPRHAGAGPAGLPQ